MLGAESNGGNVIYVKTASNKLTFEVPSRMAGSYEYEITMGVRTGQIVNRITPRNGIKGFLTGASIVDNPFKAGAKVLSLKIRAIGGGKHQDYQIDLAAGSVSARKIMQCLPSVDPAQPINLTGYDTKELNDKGNPWGDFYFRQGENFVPYAHKKTEPNGMPEPLEYVDPADNATKKTYKPVIDFFEELLKGLTYYVPADDTEQYEMKPLFGAEEAAKPVAEAPKAAAAAIPNAGQFENLEGGEDDDLPF